MAGDQASATDETAEPVIARWQGGHSAWRARHRLEKGPRGGRRYRRDLRDTRSQAP